MKFKLEKKELLKNLLWILTLFFGIAIYSFIQHKSLMWNDCFFLAGLFFMCISLFRVVRYLGLFDNTIYGFKRIRGNTSDDGRVLDFHEYHAEHPYTKPVWEMLLLGICFMAIGLI